MTCWKLMISTKRPEWEIIFNTGKKKKKVCLKPPYVRTSCERLKTQAFISVLTVQLPGLSSGQAFGTEEIWGHLLGYFRLRLCAIESFPTIKIRHWGRHVQCLTKKRINRGKWSLFPGALWSSDGVGPSPEPSLGVTAHTRESARSIPGWNS